MSTWFGYVCLSHDPPLESERWVHGHGSVEHGSDAVGDLTRTFTAVRSDPAGDWTDIGADTAWLIEHPHCRVGVKDGYGGIVELTEPAKDTDAPALEYLGEVQPGKRYLLQAKDPISPEHADLLQRRLRETYPDSTFGILSHTLAPVVPIPVPPGRSFVDVLRELAMQYQGYAMKAPPGENKAALSIVANALLDLKVALESTSPPETGDVAATPPACSPTKSAATSGEQAAVSATGVPTPEPAPSPLCGDKPITGALGCVLYAGHGGLHRDAYDNRWS